MARDPNKYREDEDLDETEDAEEDEFDGRPEQSGDDEDAELEDQTAGRQQFGRGRKSSL